MKKVILGNFSVDRAVRFAGVGCLTDFVLDLTQHFIPLPPVVGWQSAVAAQYTGKLSE